MPSYESLPCKLTRQLKKTAPKILIKRRLGGIGDVLMSTPLLRKIKELYPQCELSYATDLKYMNNALKQAIEHCPYVDKIENWRNVVDRTYDFVSDITATGLKREVSGTIPPNRIDMFAEEVGVDISSNPIPIYIVTEDEKKYASSFLDRRASGWREKSVIMVQAKSNDARRSWPIEQMRKLVNLLADAGNMVFVFDWGEGKPSIENTDLIHTFYDRSLITTAAIMDCCSLVICPDSSMLHLAAALNKRTVTVFGPVPAESRVNHYPNAEAVQLRLHCFSCWYSPRCLKTNKRLECLTSITAEMVADAALSKLMTPIQSMYKDNYTDSNLILVKRTTKGIGDILMATPGIYELKKQNPEHRIHVACPIEVHDILKNNPAIEELLDSAYPINPSRYSRVFDISTACSEYEVGCFDAKLPVKKNRTEVFASTMGFNNPESIVPRYYPTEEELNFGKEFLKKNTNPSKKTICFNLFSNEVYRNWPVEYHSILFEALSKDYNLIVLWKLNNYKDDYTIEPKTASIREKSGVLAVSDLLVTVDTSFLHIAAALDKPTIAIFGPIDYKARCRGYQNVTAMIADMPCIPCWRHGASQCAASGKIRGYSECLKAISPKAVEKLIREKI